MNIDYFVRKQELLVSKIGIKYIRIKYFELLNSTEKLVGLIDKCTDFNIMIMPSQTNTLGVSLLCNLDDEIKGNVVGYNELGDFIFSNNGEGNFNIPALNQQEGTFVSLNMKVINTNAALNFDGYCLNDLANEILDSTKEYTINYTEELNSTNEFT